MYKSTVLELHVELELTCEECGKSLKYTVGKSNEVFVEVCECCLDHAIDDAYKEGISEGERISLDKIIGMG